MVTGPCFTLTTQTKARRHSPANEKALAKTSCPRILPPVFECEIILGWNTIWGSLRDILGSPEMIDPSVGPDK